MGVRIQHFFDKYTFTLTYVVSDPNTFDAIIIDPVLDYDPANGKIWYESNEKVLKFVSEHKLNVKAILETHAHADHITGAYFIKKQLPHARVAIGHKITEVQKIFTKVFNLKNVKTDGAQFDLLLKDQESYSFGSIRVKVFSTPGHTPACSSYLIEDALFTGDVIFIPDSGTGRCDFPAGSAEDLYASVTQKIYSLPDSTRIYVGHDYQPGGRELKYTTTVGEQKAANIHIKKETTQAEFVKFRTERDKTLSAPRLLLPSIQVNIDAGHLPLAEENGVRYLKMPLKMAGD